jgi:hypothetical protein
MCLLRKRDKRVRNQRLPPPPDRVKINGITEGGGGSQTIVRDIYMIVVNAQRMQRWEEKNRDFHFSW